MSSFILANIENVEEWFCCDSQGPKGMSFGMSSFGGAYVAKCSKCSYVCAYWECPCELEHDCNK